MVERYGAGDPLRTSSTPTRSRARSRTRGRSGASPRSPTAPAVAVFAAGAGHGEKRERARRHRKHAPAPHSGTPGPHALRAARRSRATVLLRFATSFFSRAGWRGAWRGGADASRARATSAPRRSEPAASVHGFDTSTIGGLTVSLANWRLSPSSSRNAHTVFCPYAVGSPAPRPVAWYACPVAGCGFSSASISTGPGVVSNVPPHSSASLARIRSGAVAVSRAPASAETLTVIASG